MNNYVNSIGSMHIQNSSDLAAIENIKGSSKSEKEQLKKVASEFESIFIAKMLTEMDKTVDREGGLFGDKTQYVDTFKSIVYQQLGHDLASNPRSSIGLASQIYKQMEKYVGQ